MRSASKALAVAALALVAAISLCPASAQTPATTTLQSYDVELVIFRIVSPGNTGGEQLAVEGDGPELSLGVEDGEPEEAAGDAAPLPAPTTAFTPLPAAKFKLTSLEESLRRTRQYQPIAHVGWTQPGYPRNALQFLPIDSFVDPASGLKGRVGLSRGRYLHLTLDLQYDAIDPAQRVVMRTTRRMRSNERHYIDHPRFGVIAIVTPVTPG